MKRMAGLVAVMLLILGFRISMEAEEAVLSLTLNDCIVKTLKNNLRLAVEEYNPDLADTMVTRAKEMFMPRFDLSFGSQRDETPSYWWLQGSETVITKYSDYSLAVVQQIPTGGSLSLSLSNYKSDTNQLFQLINPRYGSTLRVDFSQPLLRNFGFNVSRKEIIVAENNLEISQNQFKSVLLDTIYRVQEAYWNLVYAIDNHKVKQQSLDLAKDLLEKNRKEVEVGKLAPLEILNAETVVAQREADILQADMLIKRSEDVLKNILNLAGEEGLSAKSIVPLDRPVFVMKSVTLEEALKEAGDNRPDLQVRHMDLETKELNFGVAKNQMLPGLDLQFSYWSPGISGDRILYLDDNPFLGIVVGKEEGNRFDSLRDSLKMLYNNWSIGLTLSLPLSNILTRADYTKARMEVEKSRLELEDTEQQIMLEVRDAVREIETNAKRFQAYKIARELAEKRLDAEVKKLNVGLTTNYFVLEYQEQLSSARSQEIKALVDYNLALARLDKAVGSTLEKRDIQIESR